MLKISLQKRLQAKKGAKLGIFFFYSIGVLLICKCFCQMAFSGWTFFQLFSRIWNQREILRILDTHIQKKNLKNFGVIVYGTYTYEYYW